MKTRSKVVLGIGAGAVFLLVGGKGNATIITVGASCSIVQAVSAANTNRAVGSCPAGQPDTTAIDEIRIPASSTPYDLGSSSLEIWSQMTLKGWDTATNTLAPSRANVVIVAHNNGGPTHGITTANCDNRSAAVYMTAPTVATLQNLTLQQSATSDLMGICVTGAAQLMQARVTGFRGRGIWVQSIDGFTAAHIDMTSSLVDNNHSYGPGGGISLWGAATTLSIKQSSLVSNVAEGPGGGIFLYNPGGGGTNIVTNSTVSDNTAFGDGGGLYSELENDQYLIFNNSTVAFNHATGVGGGLVRNNDGTGGSAYVQFYGSINNNNIADGSPSDPNLVDFFPIGGSVQCSDSVMYYQGDTSILGGTGNCDYVHADAGMDPVLAGNGGPDYLPLHTLVSGSVAIDKAAAGEPLDQRGYSRPQDGNLDGVKRTDAGSMEFFPYQWEAERLFISAKSSGDTNDVVNDTAASAGQNASFHSNAINDFITFQTPILPAGLYNIKVRMKKTSNAGIFQLSESNSLNGTYINYGSPQDTFATTAKTTYVEYNFGSITVSTAGQKYFKFKVTGKNASSSGFQLYPDFILLTP